MTRNYINLIDSWNVEGSVPNFTRWWRSQMLCIRLTNHGRRCKRQPMRAFDTDFSICKQENHSLNSDNARLLNREAAFADFSTNSAKLLSPNYM